MHRAVLAVRERLMLSFGISLNIISVILYFFLQSHKTCVKTQYADFLKGLTLSLLEALTSAHSIPCLLKKKFFQYHRFSKIAR